MQCGANPRLFFYELCDYFLSFDVAVELIVNFLQPETVVNEQLEVLEKASMLNSKLLFEILEGYLSHFCLESIAHQQNVPQVSHRHSLKLEP